MRTRHGLLVSIIALTSALTACGSIIIPEDESPTPEVTTPGKSDGTQVQQPTPGATCAPGQCLIAGACFDDGATSASNPCRVCDVTASAAGWTDRLCDDGDPCTTDTCSTATGSCTAQPLDCGPDTGCTAQVCSSGECVAKAEAASCDDGDACTTDTCDLTTGDCLHKALDCGPQEGCMGRGCQDGKCEDQPGDCDDANPCTTDSCDASTGQCQHAWKSCDDGDLCTDDFCNTQSGQCDHFPQPGCGGTCVPDCAGRVCGPDGCGGECGFCVPGDLCSFDGACMPDDAHTCDSVGPAGCCDPSGGAASCNTTGGINVEDCAEQGLKCGWVPSAGRYGCTTDGMPEPGGTEPQWCGPPTPGGSCGDGVCGGPENCVSCATDCGHCSEQPECCAPKTSPGCGVPSIVECVCAQDPYCCENSWDETCVSEVQSFGCGSCEK